jgi:hypothetical protein
MDKQTQAWPHSRIILSKEELGIATWWWISNAFY